MVDIATYVPGTFPPCTSGDVYTEWYKDEDGHPTVEYRTVNGIWSRVVEYAYHGTNTYEVTWHPEIVPHPATVDGPQPRIFTEMDEAVRYAKRLIK